MIEKAESQSIEKDGHTIFTSPERSKALAICE